MSRRPLAMLGVAALAAALISVPAPAFAATELAIDFEADGYTLGQHSPNGQNGWTGGGTTADYALVANSAFPDSGLSAGRSLRYSNAVSSGDYLQTPEIEAAGEPGYGADYNTFDAEFTVTSATGEAQPGLNVMVNLDSASRYGGVINLHHTGDALEIGSFWVPEGAPNVAVGSWVSSIFATVPADEPHTIRVSAYFLEDESDVLEVFVDGELVSAGTGASTWEHYYEILGSGGGDKTVNELSFRPSASVPRADGISYDSAPAVPALENGGFLFGDISFSVRNGEPTPPATLVIDFDDDYSTGDPDGQPNHNGWSVGDAAIDFAIVDNADYEDAGFGTNGKSLRFSNAVTSGNIVQLASPKVVAAGESGTGASSNHFGANFMIASATGGFQEDLRIEISADRNGSRYSGPIIFEHVTDDEDNSGLRIGSAWLPSTVNVDDNPQYDNAIAEGPLPGGFYDPAVPHEITLIATFVDDAPDVIDVYVDGELAFTTPGWEHLNTLYGGAPDTVDSLLFRAATIAPDPDGTGMLGTSNAGSDAALDAVPDHLGYGFLIDDLVFGEEIDGPIIPVVEDEPNELTPWGPLAGTLLNWQDGAEVALYLNGSGTAFDTVEADGPDGAWSFNVNSLTPGVYDYTVTALLGSEEHSSASGGFTLIGTHNPVVTSSPGGVVGDVTALSGTIPNFVPGMTIELFLDGADTPDDSMAPTGTTGSWSFDLDELGVGTHQYRLEVVWDGNGVGLRTGSFAVTAAGPELSGLPNRIEGPNRYATAAAIAGEWDEIFDGDVVFVATGENYPDALSAAAAAVHLGAPVVLTNKNELPSVVKNRLNALQPDTIIVLGSSAAVSNKVFNALKTVSGSPTVVRWQGADRYATMREIIKNAFGVNGNGDGAENVNLETVVIATGENFPDALSAGPAAASAGGAVILVNGKASSIPTATLNLIRDLEPQEIVIAGSTAAVKKAVENQLKSVFGSGKVTRVQGATREATSVALTDHFFDEADVVFFAVSSNFPDALAGAALAGAIDAPLLVTAKSCVTPAAQSLVNALDPAKKVLLGSSAAISSSVASLKLC